VTAPTFVNHQQSVWNTSGATKAVTITVQTGDILVVGCVAADSNSAVFTVPTNDGTGLSWSNRISLVSANNVEMGVWTAPVDSNRTIVITGHETTLATFWGMFARAWRGSDGVGAVGSIEGDTTANFSANITTTQANSAIDSVQGDWSAVSGARTALAGAGAWTEKTNVNLSTQYNIVTGYHADAGAAGTYAVGSSAPSGQDLSIGLVEIKGTAAGGDTIMAQTLL